MMQRMLSTLMCVRMALSPERTLVGPLSRGGWVKRYRPTPRMVAGDHPPHPLPRLSVSPPGLWLGTPPRFDKPLGAKVAKVAWRRRARERESDSKCVALPEASLRGFPCAGDYLLQGGRAGGSGRFPSARSKRSWCCLGMTVCPSGLRGWTQVPLAQAAWAQIPQVSLSCC